MDDVFSMVDILAAIHDAGGKIELAKLKNHELLSPMLQLLNPTLQRLQEDGWIKIEGDVVTLVEEKRKIVEILRVAKNFYEEAGKIVVEVDALPFEKRIPYLNSLCELASNSMRKILSIVNEANNISYIERIAKFECSCKWMLNYLNSIQIASNKAIDEKMNLLSKYRDFKSLLLN